MRFSALFVIAWSAFALVSALDETALRGKNSLLASTSQDHRELGGGGILLAIFGIFNGIISLILSIISGPPNQEFDCSLTCDASRVVFNNGQAVVALFDSCKTILFCDSVGGKATEKIDCPEGKFATPLGCIDGDILPGIIGPSCVAIECNTLERNTPLPDTTLNTGDIFS